ncbi:hypothetical protein BD410DRAFT_784120 [Rickenella mellea]|uniref:F5/8 type C domain-containing protein n=1 Tax=Rickenella mellea TaxID=50990 RepID=A0A4Y7QEJ9_9AGAM|nr:hypothetical protein BD410DRAFT_784120 [Rickenella mellea]
MPYFIAGSSEHSGRYGPENIKFDKPNDQSSRWSGAYLAPSAKQWLLLELRSVGVLKSITFGKFHKPHPCNMKEFKVHTGMAKDHLTEVLHASLKNDSVPETFHLSSRSETVSPAMFVKIVPISAHGHNFNTSIWYVSLRGITDEMYVGQVNEKYEQAREVNAMRHILKHLRQRRHISVYRQLLSNTGIKLEHPLVTQLYNSVVLRGDFILASSLLSSFASLGLFTSYIHSCRPTASWKRLAALDANGDAPSRRGGHAMCMDAERQLIYLFGGWDGQRSLDDFWMYDVQVERWTVLSHNVGEEKNGPGPRACHKMCFDPKTGCIYLLGRLSDGEPSEEGERDGAVNGAPPDMDATREAPNTDVPVANGGTSDAAAARPAANASSKGYHSSEFYRYRTRGLDRGKWELLATDTGAAGGPPLVYDHQLVIDPEEQVLYVHGGRVVDGDWSSVKYSGLYSYDIRTSKWKALQMSSSIADLTVPPRFGHSMLLVPDRKSLFIFAGQQDEQYLSDMWECDLATNTVSELFSNLTASGGPDACFAQRAAIDPNLKEVYVFGGLTKDKTSRQSVACAGSSLWLLRYDKTPGQWTRVLPQSPRSSAVASVSSNQGVEDYPRARCAHQVVYDLHTKTFYMHGGNAGFAYGTTQREGGTVDARRESESRLDDFWSMTLKRPEPEEVIRRATFKLRQQQFREMCEEQPPVKALSFLQNDVSAVVDHDNQTEAMTFRSLLSYLLAPQTPVEDNKQQTALEQHDTPMTMDHDYLESSGSRDDMQEVSMAEDNSTLSDKRFKQRTEIFESLLTFINSEAKQPSEELLDILSADG